MAVGDPARPGPAVPRSAAGGGRGARGRRRERRAGARGGGPGPGGCPRRRTTAPGVLRGGRGTAPSGSPPLLWATRRRGGAVLGCQWRRWCRSARPVGPPPWTRAAPAAPVRPAAEGSSRDSPWPGPPWRSVSPKAVRAGRAAGGRTAGGAGALAAFRGGCGAVKPPLRGSAGPLRAGPVPQRRPGGQGLGEREAEPG